MHGRALHVTNTDRISDAIIGVDWALEDEPRRQGTAFNARVAGEALVLRGLGTAALAMAWVAAGRLDAYINHQLKPWDVAAAALLVKQAGGVTGDISGRPLSFDRDGLSCLLTNSQLQELLAAVAV
jgi:myo-inositol-1(or 4)-monophosphatase